MSRGTFTAYDAEKWSKGGHTRGEDAKTDFNISPERDVGGCPEPVRVCEGVEEGHSDDGCGAGTTYTYQKMPQAIRCTKRGNLHASHPQNSHNHELRPFIHLQIPD